jgi:hypothetical protein
MDGFELNKILGAILATCILVLSVDLIANAIFAPVKPAKPGFEIAVKEQPPANATASKTENVAPIETHLAKADVDRGKSETKVCMALWRRLWWLRSDQGARQGSVVGIAGRATAGGFVLRIKATRHP